jgi:hypothetical protein
MGGAYYLFIRGMLPGDKHKTSKSRGGGIYFNKPSSDFIEALDGLFVESFLEQSAMSNAL